jgi:hypothetical protein
MLTVNTLALALGIIAAMTIGSISGQIYSIGLGIILLIGFSLAAYFLDFNRLYLYGLLVGLSPLVGEWLWIQGHASHHGFPITFGITSGIMILTGLIVFIRFLRNNPIPTMEASVEEG